MKKSIFTSAVVFILTAALVLSGYPIVAHAVTADKAVEWAIARVGKWTVDANGRQRGQCVDLVEAYTHEFFGWQAKADAKDYSTVNIPGKWTRIKYTDGFVPAPGDIAIWMPGKGPLDWIIDSGHVAIVISATSKEIVSVDQNWNAEDYSVGTPAKQVTHSYTFFWGVIRPPFDVDASTPPPPQHLFDASEWAQAELGRANTLGLIPDSFLSMDLKKNAARIEFCAMAVTLYETVAGVTITGFQIFDDCQDASVGKMAALGVVNGTGNNKFTPDGVLSREQAATILARLAGAMGYPLPKKAATFADTGSVSNWAAEAVGQVQAAGIMSGTGNNMFSPKRPYTREQSLVTLLRLYDYVMGSQ